MQSKSFVLEMDDASSSYLWYNANLRSSSACPIASVNDLILDSIKSWSYSSSLTESAMGEVGESSRFSSNNSLRTIFLQFGSELSMYPAQISRSFSAEIQSSVLHDWWIPLANYCRSNNSSPSNRSSLAVNSSGYNPVFLTHFWIVSEDISSNACLSHSIDISKLTDFTISLVLFYPSILPHTYRSNPFMYFTFQLEMIPASSG